jgi:hypothetical protein
MNQPKATSSQILSARLAVNFVGRCAGRLGLVARFAFGRVRGMDGFYASKLGELEPFVTRGPDRDREIPRGIRGLESSVATSPTRACARRLDESESVRGPAI